MTREVPDGKSPGGKPSVLLEDLRRLASVWEKLLRPEIEKMAGVAEERSQSAGVDLDERPDEGGQS